MKIWLNGCGMERNDLEDIMNHEAKFVYCIDECDDNYYTPERAMEEAEGLADGWIGDLYVCEYAVNVQWNDEDRCYELIDEFEPPLSFTGRYWTHTPDGWKEEA